MCLTKQGPLVFKGNWLLTSPVEDQMWWGMMAFHYKSSFSLNSSLPRNQKV